MEFEELFSAPFIANDEAVLKRFKSNGLPVVMYGASIDVADGIARKLAANGTPVAMLAYDDEKTPMTGAYSLLLKGLSRMSVSELDANHGRFNVVAGFVKGYCSCDAYYLSEIFDMEPVTERFIRENKPALKALYDSFADSCSKASFVAYLMSKTRQDMKYLPEVFDKIQYFTKDIFHPTRHESYFDCGAFTGDTVAEFLKACDGKYNRIWAVEPDKTNFEQLKQYVENKQLTNIDIFNGGIYSRKGCMSFRAESSMLSMLDEASADSIEVDTIDNIVGCEPVTYIKFDVEGAELEALKGAEKTIRRCRPMMGVSIYHKQNDLTDIPAYIRSLYPDYKFAFRVHKKLAIDTVLYCYA
ncbi:MAG: FkbM family methyltransferase [Tannerella sp.]|jgi:FkbM family methyltransferase|nr:FkbM family methyltransferase [Tannerella sp.]